MNISIRPRVVYIAFWAYLDSALANLPETASCLATNIRTLFLIARFSQCRRAWAEDTSAGSRLPCLTRAASAWAQRASASRSSGLARSERRNPWLLIRRRAATAAVASPPRLPRRPRGRPLPPLSPSARLRPPHPILPAQSLPDSAARGPSSGSGASVSASASAGASPSFRSPGAGRGPHQFPAPLCTLQGRPQRAPRPLSLSLPSVRCRPRRGRRPDLARLHRANRRPYHPSMQAGKLGCREPRAVRARRPTPRRGGEGRDGGSERPGDYGAAQKEPDPGLQHQQTVVLLRQPRQCHF